MDKYQYTNLHFTSGDIRFLVDTLNELGAKGWHVVSSTPCGYYQVLQSSMDGWRSINYDILLERKINSEAPVDDIKSEKTVSDEKKEETVEDLKSRIKSYDDLMNDPKIKEEAETMRKFYGKEAYEHYLEKKAKELGVEK